MYERVSAATQSLELNEQTYNKAAYFTNDGQIDKDILQATLEKNQLVLANASDNSYSLDSNGLQFQSLLNPAKKIRILADGIFLSNSSSKRVKLPSRTLYEKRLVNSCPLSVWTHSIGIGNAFIKCWRNIMEE